MGYNRCPLMCEVRGEDDSRNALYRKQLSMERAENPRSKGSVKVPEREINVRKTDLWYIQVHIQIISIRI